MKPFSKGVAEPYMLPTLVLLIVTGRGLAQPLKIAAAAQHRYGPGACGPADPVYIKSAMMTGGQPFFMSPGEISKAAHIMSASSQSELMLWAAGEGTTRYVVHVDSSVKRASFSATFDNTGGTLTVISPEGVAVQPGDTIEDTVLSCGRVVTVDSPAAGSWQVAVVPSGRFWLVTHAKTDLSIVSAEFVAPGGRPGHEGLFKISGMPIAGREAMLRVLVVSAPKRPAFQLVSIDAQRLQTIALEPESDDEFVGPVTLPDRPFRLMVSGVDESGTRFQRVFPTLFSAETIEVIPSVGVDTVTPGESTPISFTVRNSGPAVHLRFTATGAGGKRLPVEAATADLASGSEVIVTVRVALPADAAPGSDASVLLTAAADAPSESMNYARQQLTVRRVRVP
jgi:hypothetical protein